MEDHTPGNEENLVDLINPTESSILHALQDRFDRKRIYTTISGLLVAVNPFEKYCIYDESVISQFKEANQTAHIFSIARDALTGIREGSDAENIVFSGESGSGKSFNAAQVMKYLATSESSKVTQKHIDAIQTIFNSFATAKTAKNNSATRFGYAADFLFKKNILSGLSLRNTLPLETVRVVSQKSGERNFNVFYEVYSGLDTELKGKYGVKDGQKFFYMNQGKTADSTEEDSQRFQKLDNSLEVVGFSAEQRQLIYKTIVAILHIGNVYYRQKRTTVESSPERVEVGNEGEIKWAAYLLELNLSQWAPTFIQRIVKAEEGFTSTFYNMGQALDARDSQAQMLYEELFGWIVSRIGLHLKCPDHTAVVTVVDFYGFEKYINNGLEQLLINSVNERLESTFVKQTFNEPMENYIREGVHAPVEIPQHLDNSKVVEILCKKPYGILNLLDDESKFPKGSDESFLEHCNLNHIGNSVYGKPRNKERLEFSVRHQSGNTFYSICDYVHRNKRSVPGIVVKTLAESQNSVISMLFRPLAAGREKGDYVVYHAHQFSSAAQTIAEKILDGNSHYVRCIRSNNERTAAKFDVTTVSRQLKSLAISEVVNFRLKGYPVRIPFLIFAQSYRCLLPSDIALCQNQKEIIVDILEGQGMKHAGNFKIGRNYVFLREKLHSRLMLAREKARREAGQVIQKTMRAFVQRKKYLRVRRSTIVLQSGLRGWKARKETAAAREELFKSLGKQSRRNKRLNAYHDGLQDPTAQEHVPSTMVGYLDMDSDASDVLERASNRSEERIETKKTSDYISIPIKRRVKIETIGLEQFAEKHYKGHLVEVRREPVITPFLHKENDLDFRLSIEIFKLVLKYMNDAKLSKNQLNELARYIVLQGINNPCQRDEIFVQLCNQCYRNRDRVAVERGRRLIALSVSAFPPTENIIPMLYGFADDMPGPVRSFIQDTIQRRLKIHSDQTSRSLPASQLELLSLNSNSNPAVTVSCHDGKEQQMETHPWTTNAEIAHRMLRQRGIGDPSGWTLELEGEGKIYSSTGSHFFHDVLAELEMGKQANEKSFFLNFSTDRTLPPVNKKTLPAVEPPKVMSPVERRRHISNNRESHASRRDHSAEPISPRLPPKDRSVDDSLNKSLTRVPPESMGGLREDESDYCYTLPNKKHSANDVRGTNSMGRMVDRDDSPALERHKPYEAMMESPAILQQSHVPHSYQKPTSDDRTELYVPNYAYATQQAMPMIQYVPVVMPQHMGPMMQSNMPMGAPMGYAQYPQMNHQIPYQAPRPVGTDNSIHQEAHNNHIQEEQPFGSISSRSHKDFDSVRSCRDDSRPLSSRDECVPSEYSSMSVASRIRRMPVPDNQKDVDRFLDEVFDQVLSPDEFKEDAFNPRQIAASIKGGAYGPSDYNETYDKQDYNDGYRTVYDHAPGADYYQSGSDRYDYIDRERASQRQPVEYRREETRARSLPRYQADYEEFDAGRQLNVTNKSNKSNGYSQIKESSVDRSPAMSRRGQFELAPPSTPIPAPPQTTNYGGTQMMMMMPVQMHENGQMIPMMMPQHMTMIPQGTIQQTMHTGYNGFPAPNQNIHSRHRSIDSYTRRSQTPEVREVRRPPSKQMVSPPAAPGRFESPRTMRAVLQQNRPQMENSMPRIPRASPVAVASPELRSPATERKLGLNRIPLTEYKEPVVQNTVSNSEHLNPNKMRNPEKNVVRDIQAKEKEALRKINERLKKLPPPVENVRVFIPKPQPAIPVVEKKKALDIPEEPDWTHPIYFPPVEPVRAEPPRNEWIFEGDVERPIELQERLKTPLVADPILPPIPQQNVHIQREQEKTAVKYLKQPWKLTIRKEMFMPREILDEVQVIDQVFAQIVADCRRAIAYRIRAYERDDVVAILKDHKVPPELLNRQSEIPTSIKLEIIEAARKWPLYFSQIYEVVEERMDESVSVLLSIAEHGIRLLMHTPLDKENPLKVQDHFGFHDIVEANLENDDVVCIHTRAGMYIRLRTKMASQIKNQLEKCLYGGTKQRRFVKAMADYITNQPNLLSFNNGDIIELVGRPEGEDEMADSWLYGKIGNVFGNLPSQYVVPLDENMSEMDTPAPPPPTIPMVNDDSLDVHSFNEVLDDHNEDMFSMRDRGEKYTMLEFATKYFRVPKGYDTTLRRGKKEWTWQEVANKIKWTDRPISHSLLRLETTELDKLAVETFQSIMRYMGDEPCKRGETMTDTVYRLLLICHKHQGIRDEMYCQIIRQTTNNKSSKAESSIRGWRLFSILTAYFDCSAALKPYLLSYLADNADDRRRAYHGTAQLCLVNFRQTLQYGGRKYLLSGMEVEEITNGKILKRQVYMLPGGHKKVFNTRSVTVAEEVIQELCNELNIRSSSEQQEFSLCYVTEKDNQVEYLSNNDYILDICTELEHKKISFNFLLKRLVWVHPLRLDNPIYVDVMFFQTMPDYLDGSFVSLQDGGHLSASMTDDIIQMAGLLHLAANEGRQHAVNGKAIQSLIPANILELRVMHNEQWADRINRRLVQMCIKLSPTQARAAFLERLSHWPLFGVVSFPLASCMVDGHPLPSVLVSIGKNGMSLIQPLSHRVYEEYPFDKVSATRLHKDGDTSLIEVIVESEHGQRTYEMKTNEAAAINRLLTQYKFVVDENHGLIA